MSLNKKLYLFNNKIILYNYYISKLFFNNLKFNTCNILLLKKIMSKLLMKKVNFSITNVKYPHLNKNILINKMKHVLKTLNLLL